MKIILSNHIWKFFNKLLLKLGQDIDLVHDQYQHGVLANRFFFELTYSLRYLFDTCLALDYHFRSMQVFISPYLC
jgi:hypothetical protein